MLLSVGYLKRGKMMVWELREVEIVPSDWL